MGSSRRAKFGARIATGCSKQKSQKQVRFIWFELDAKGLSNPVKVFMGASEMHRWRDRSWDVIAGICKSLGSPTARHCQRADPPACFFLFSTQADVCTENEKLR